MSGESAITKIKSRCLAWLTGEIGTGIDVHMDRKAGNPFRDEDLPCVNIRCQEFRIITRDYSADTWEAAVMFDVLAPSSVLSTIDVDQAEIMSDIIARLAERTSAAGTIGELLEICEPLTAGAQQDELNLSDFGVATLAYRMVFRTPRDDFRTIAGHNGHVT